MGEHGERKQEMALEWASFPLPFLPFHAYRHKAAYYTQRTEDRLGTIDDISALRDIVVPPGYFLSNADIRSNKPVDAPHSTQRAYNAMHQAPDSLQNTPSPDLPSTSPYSTGSSVL